jgi:hypothetical protein
MIAGMRLLLWSTTAALPYATLDPVRRDEERAWLPGLAVATSIPRLAARPLADALRDRKVARR